MPTIAVFSKKIVSSPYSTMTIRWLRRKATPNHVDLRTKTARKPKRIGEAARKRKKRISNSNSKSNKLR